MLHWVALRKLWVRMLSNNALKLFGDQWLARLHHAATHRMHIDDYERSVLRKIETLDSIYGKIRDRQVQVRGVQGVE